MAAQLGASWGEKEQLLSDAASKDRKRMEELNKIFTTVSRSRVPIGISINELRIGR